MRPRPVLVALVLLALVLLGVAGATGWRWVTRDTGFAAAVALAPAGTERVGWTDWAAVRGSAGVRTAAELAATLDRAYDDDLLAASALATSAETLRDRFEVSPANVDWELFTQSPDGAALLLRLPDDFSFDVLADRLSSSGFTPPGEPDAVWRGGPDVVARLGPLTPQVQHWVLLEDDGLVVTSDTAEYAETAAAAVVGDGERIDGLSPVVEASGAPVSALVYASAYTCEHLAMAQADGGDQDQAAELVSAAGSVDPVTGFAMSRQADGDVRVAMSFASDDRARTNADTRAVLAGGPAPGQGGDFRDRFALRSATADDGVVVLELEPVDGVAVVSDLSTGPVLFATC